MKQAKETSVCVYFGAAKSLSANRVIDEIGPKTKFFELRLGHNLVIFTVLCY